MSQISDSVIEVCQDRGLKFKKQGGEFYSACPFHGDGKRPNFRVNVEKNSWFCDVCNEGGGAVEFIAKLEHRDKKEVFRELVSKEAPAPMGPAGEIVATYDYTDRLGNLVYQVCRMSPKSFRQRRPDGKGGWIWNMEGIERVLYRLRDIQKPQNKHVWIVEGEKDVETIRGLGMAATCNVGGAGKWCDAYSRELKDKEVLLCGDNDDAGRKHVEKVLESIEGHASSVRRIEIPAPFKDVSDYAASFNDKQKLIAALMDMIDGAQVMLRGGTLPIKNMAELEREYIQEVKNSKTALVRLSDWLPSLRCVRPLIRGELVSIVGDTGTAKTYVLQHIAMLCRVPTLLFELELPDALTFERFAGIANRKSGYDVYETYSASGAMDYSTVSHVYTCTKAGLAPADLEGIINRAELKMANRPTLVLVDYVQLMGGGVGKSRYERVSAVAEQLKTVAKNTGTVVIMASQVGRDRQSVEVHLHDAKDSGSIENSSGVVIGIWRDDNEADTLNIRVLKNTKGRPSDVIKCHIDTSCMRITEAPKITEADTDFTTPQDKR